MTTVFLSGSRKISRLNDMIRTRLQNIIDQNFRIVVGDANGADKALQSYLAERGYRNVGVFCAGQVCRNNLGGWDVHEVAVDPKLKGRAFYTQKDKEMAAQADYGFVLWDGKSAGSMNNVYELLENGKKAVVYLSLAKRFVTVSGKDDADALIQTCEPSDYRAIHKMLGMIRQHGNAQPERQGALNL